MTGRPVVGTAHGTVAGARIGSVDAFLGIPYAGPVSGPARFGAPTAVQPWPGVLDALAFGPASPQSDQRAAAPREYAEVLRLYYPGSGSPLEGRVSDEDSLVLNVWTPEASPVSRRPVMVWLHGGAFLTGTGAESWFQGDRLAARGDVVVVSLNHRLGLLGYLPPDVLGDRTAASGVAGMLDIVQALAWVRENIAAFGGDPGNVTVFGQSGGGVKTLALMGMPAAHGLFHKAVVQSVPFTGVLDDAGAERVAGALHETLGRDGAAALRTMPVTDLLRLQDDLVARLGPGALAPSVHGEHLPTDPFRAGAPAEVDQVPLVIGHTRHEFAAFAALDPAYHRMTDEDLAPRFAAAFGSRSSAVLEHVRSVEGDVPPQLVLSRAMTDATFLPPVRALVARKGSQSAPVFAYRLDHRTDVLGGILGAHHSADLPLVFQNVDRSPITGGGSSRHVVADAMADAWTSFARSGDPSHAGIGTWAPTSEGTFMRFDGRSGPERFEASASVPELDLFG
jgi:para-nitrobenzyl esterase